MNTYLIPRTLALGLLPTLAAWQANAAWITPYDPNSTPDQILRYVGSQVDDTAPDASATLAGITYNNNPALATGAGANLYVQGSTAFSVLGAVVARTNSQVSVGGGTPGLRFNTVTSGLLGDLASVAPNITWRGTSEVTGSDVWDTYGSTNYRYVFDIQLNNSLLGGLGLSLFEGVSLQITAGSEVLYYAEGLTTILGLPSILNSSYQDVAIYFEYDQSWGPITVQWEATSVVTGNILSGLGGGVANVFTFQNARLEVDAIPEPSSALAVLSGVGTLWALRFRRRR